MERSYHAGSRLRKPEGTDEWELVKTLGRGESGVVYRAIRVDDLGNTEESAIKVIVSFINDSGDLTQLTDKEERAARIEAVLEKVKDVPHIVKYEDFFRIPFVDDHPETGFYLIIRMESLAPVDTKKFMSEKDVAKLGRDICSALEACEKLEIIHRDIKLSNILVTENGDYKLGDFGVAYIPTEGRTRTALAGTFDYMAPEVFRQEKFGFTVDTYSLGMTLYRILKNENFSKDFTSNRLKGDALPPLEKVNYVNYPLWRIIQKACEYDPAKRYPNASTMKKDLQSYLAYLDGVLGIEELEFLGDATISIFTRPPELPPEPQPPPPPEPQPPPPPEPQPSPPPIPLPSPFPKRRAIMIAAIAMIALLIVAVCWPLHSIKLEPDTLSAHPGETYSIEVIPSPRNAKLPDIQWSVSAPEVVSVENGIVTTAQLGTATITAQCGKFSAVCVVEVEALPVPAERVTLNSQARNVEIGESIPLSAEVTPPNATDALIWSSEDETIASVGEDGSVMGIAPGETTITVVCGEQRDHCKVTVQEKAVWSDWMDALPEEVDLDNAVVEEKTQYSSRTRQTRESAYPSIDGWSLISHSDSFGEYGVWSAWSDSEPKASDTTHVESKQQYRFRTRETKESAYSSLEGWTLIDTNSSYGDYGAWSGWTTSNPGSPTNTMQVESKEQYRSQNRETKESAYSPIEGWTLIDTVSSYGEYEPWSGWTTSNPGNSTNTMQVESKKQYRSRSREQTTSTSSSMDGWTRVSSSSSYGDYGTWSDWTTIPAQNSEITNVETKQQYRYRDLQTTTNESPNLSNWNRTGGPYYGDWGGTQTSSSRPSESDTLRITDTKQIRWGYYHYCNQYPNNTNGWNVDSIAYGSSSTYHSYTTTFALPTFSMPDKGNQQAYGGLGSGASACPWNFYAWFRDSGQDAYEYSYQTRNVYYSFDRWGDWSGWSDTPVSDSSTRSVETRTLYRSRTRTQNNTYTYERWGNWSDWLDTAMSATASLEVDTRTVYRSRTRTQTNTYTYERWGNWSDWSDNPISATSSRKVETRTLYRSRTRTQTNTYTHERWSTWSDWSDNAISATASRQVDTRTLYRSQTRTKTTTYVHEQWSAWSDYSDISVSASDSIEIRMRKLYRYQKSANS